LEISKATANRLLATLEDTGMVRRHPETGKYALGLAALRIGIAAGNQIELRRDLRLSLTELMQRTGETSNLVIFDATCPVFIDNVESIHTLRMYSRVGKRTSPYCTAAGKAMMAFQSRDFVEQVFKVEPFEKRTPNTINDRQAFLEELDRVKEQGYAIDDEEGEMGARCVGAPILNHSGCAVAAISISGPSSRVTKAKIPELARIVCEVAERALRSL
jgi:DNA-binding IclR family transcriptional regulator